MRRRLTSLAIMIIVVIPLLAWGGAANAQRVEVSDPAGDGPSTYPDHDIKRLVVDHRHNAVAFELEYYQPARMDTFNIELDTQGGGPVEFDVFWSTYAQPGGVGVYRREGSNRPRCQPRIHGDELVDTTFRFVVPRRCLDRPRFIRARVHSSQADDQSNDPSESTDWTPWARRADDRSLRRATVKDKKDKGAYDIRKVKLKTAGADGDKLKLKVRLDKGPRKDAEFQFLLDTAAPSKWGYKVRAGHKGNRRVVTVTDRSGKKTCQFKRAKIKRKAHVITIPARCSGDVAWTRVKSKVRRETRSKGWHDKAKWSEWVRQ